MQACSAIRVLELSRGFNVAALCGQLLAGLGATVKSIEPAGGSSLRRQGPLTGDGNSYLFHLLQAGKETLQIAGDWRADHAQISTLVEWADIVLVDQEGDNSVPAFDDLQAVETRWPGKIVCAVSLYGQRSSHPHWRGNELVAEAAGALMSCTGYPERPPVASCLPYALHTCALFAFNGVMTALWERDRSKRGQTLDLAIVDCIVAILGNFLPSYFLSGRAPKRIGNRHTIAAPWNLYPAADGSVVICTGTGGTGWWAKVMAVLGRPELIEDPRYKTEADRVRNVDEVDAILADWTRGRTMATIVEQMTARGVPVSEISTIEAVLADPHYRELRAMVMPSSVRTVGGKPLPAIGTPLKVGTWHNDLKVEHPAAPLPARREPEDDATLRGSGDPGRPGPLAGIRVLEFASRTSVPLAGRLMADLGAEIVKIEPAKGDALRGAGQRLGDSSYLFHINNAGKRSVVIEPTDPQGRQLVLDLVAHADVFIENLAPGSLQKLGLGYEALKTANPRILYCSVNGFGERSSYGGKRALDTVVQAACGLMYMTGYSDHFPVKLGISAIDLTTATAVMAAVLAGLRERRATGVGSHIDLAMADIGVWMTQSRWPQILCAGEHPIRLGNRSHASAPHDLYPTRDEVWVAIAVETQTQWQVLVELINRPELQAAELDDASERLRQRDRIDEAIGRWTGSQTAQAVAELCQGNGVPASVVRDLAGLASDANVSTRHMIVSLNHPAAGTVRLLGNPLALSRTPPVIAQPAPLLGQHTQEILSGWLGLPSDQIAALAAAGTIVMRTEPLPAAATAAAVMI